MACQRDTQIAEKALLAKIVISRQGGWLDPEAASDQYGDVFGHVLAELV